MTLAHSRDSYRPFTLVVRPSNSSVAPGAAVVSVMAGMGSDWALGRQRRLTGMLLGWTRGLIVIHDSRCSSTWAWSSSWERWTGWHGVGSKWEGSANQIILTYLVGCSWWWCMNVCSTCISSGQINPRRLNAEVYWFWICFGKHHLFSLTWAFLITKKNIVELKETFIMTMLAKTTLAND